jgi:hypothetical protein
MKKSKRKDMGLEELIGHLIAISTRIERETGGYMSFQMQFGPKAQPPGKKAMEVAAAKPW